MRVVVVNNQRRGGGMRRGVRGGRATKLKDHRWPESPKSRGRSQPEMIK
jgi:hypothetical protein